MAPNEGQTRSLKQEGHEALNRSPEYTGQSQTFNLIELWFQVTQLFLGKTSFKFEI